MIENCQGKLAERALDGKQQKVRDGEQRIDAFICGLFLNTISVRIPRGLMLRMRKRLRGSSKNYGPA